MAAPLVLRPEHTRPCLLAHLDPQSESRHLQRVGAEVSGRLTMLRCDNSPQDRSSSVPRSYETVPAVRGRGLIAEAAQPDIG